MEKIRRNSKSVNVSQTRLERSFEKFESDFERNSQLQSISPWAGGDNTFKSRQKRLTRAMKNFWYFDKTYFPPEAHRQGYAKPGLLHRTMLRLATEPGIHWILAHRSLAKTAYAVKIRVWMLLSNQMANLGIMSETKPKAQSIMRAYEGLFKYNDRLKSDFEIEIIQSNNDGLMFTSVNNRIPCTITPFSLGKNPRGEVSTNLDRLDALDFDDVETTTTSFDEEIVETRIKKLVEAWKSLKQSGNMMGYGNNLDPKCAANKLKKEQENDAKRDFITVYPFPDWVGKRTSGIPYTGSVWPEMYPAKSEKQMREMHMITDDEEWSQAQCDPKKKGGRVFPESLRQMCKKNDMPGDIRAIAFCDPNLSKSGKGDTTCMGLMYYSPKQNKFYASNIRSKSFSDPNELLDNFFALFGVGKARILFMDGNVAQESTWSALIDNWCMIKGRAAPPVVFKRYRVDDFIAAAKMPYHGRNVYFVDNFIDEEEKERFFEQLHGFTSKKAGKKDDAADWFISVLTAGWEERYFVASSGNLAQDYRVQTIIPSFGY